MTVPNRSYSSPSYRYGFQGQEKDDEIKGESNSINFKYRMYDPRSGRMNSIDPLSNQYPYYTPYAFSGNSTIMASELEGLEPDVEDGVLVGYVVQKGFGPSYIAADLNDPATQEKYGYCLQKPVTFEQVVQQNEDYYRTAGADGDLYYIGNKSYNNLNSNEDDWIKFELPKDTEQIVTQTSKNISKPEGMIKRDVYNNIWGESTVGNGPGWAQARAKGNEKIHYMNWNDIGYSGPIKNKGLTRGSNPKNYDFLNAIKAWIKGVNLLSGKKDIKTQKKEVEKEVTIKIPDFEKGMQWQRANEHTSNMIGDYSTKDTLVKEKEEDKIKDKYRKRKNDSIKKNIDNR